MAFDFDKETIELGGKTLKMFMWQVWFQTPLGLFQDLAIACQRCKDNNLDPNAVISPCPVAIDEAGRYEIILRG